MAAGEHRDAPLSASQVAEYFLFKAQESKKPVTNKKLQKLLYYAQAWSLATRNERLFEDKIEAWVHGPAIKSIYLSFKEYGATPITKQAETLQVQAISPEIQGFLDQIWTIYGKFDGGYLEQLTHSESPWIDARQGLEANQSSEIEITPEAMQTYYSARLVKKG